MNILYINHYAGSKKYGMEFRPYYFAKELVKRGYKVTMIAADFSHLRDKNPNISKSLEDENIDGINYSWIKTSNYEGNGLNRIINMMQFTFKFFINSKKIFYKYKPDIVHASSPHPLTWLSGYFLSKKYNVKFIVETRDLWPETFVSMGKMKKNSIPAKILYKLEKFIYKKADKLIFTMEDGYEYIKDKGWDNDILANKVNYINNGIDLEEFRGNLEKYRLEDADLSDDESFKVVYAGSIGEPNMVITIVESAVYFKNIGINDIKFIIYGDGLLRSKLMKYASDNNLKNIKFKGRVDKKYIPFVLNSGNMNIIVGKDIDLYKYGFSQNKFFDYLASGRPTISNRNCHEILDDLQCGLTVKNGSIEALVDGILKFYNMPKEEYETYCENAFKAAEDFDFKVLTDKLEKVILED